MRIYTTFQQEHQTVLHVAPGGTPPVPQGPVSIDGILCYIDHSYTLPGEKNELYWKLRAENAMYVGTSNDMDSGLIQGLELYADIDYEYNYYSKEIQHLGGILGLHNFFPGGSQGTANVDAMANGRLFPSLNSFLLYAAGISSAQDPYETLLTFGGLLEYENLGMTTDTDPAAAVNLNFAGLHVNAYSSDYFRAVSHTIMKYGMNISPDTYAPFNPNPSVLFDQMSIYDSLIDSANAWYSKPQFINKEMTSLYRDIDNKRELFPFYAKIYWDGVRDSAVANILEEAGLDGEFIEYLARDKNVNNFNVLYFTREATAQSTEGTMLTEPVSGYSWPAFLDFLESGTSTGMRTEATEGQSACNILESLIKSQLAKNSIASYTTSHSVGTTSAVAFVVYKFFPDQHSLAGEPVSVDYFFNYEDMKRFMFHDTQVPYGIPFLYKINVINSLVAGVGGANMANKLVFLEEPYYEENIHILDSPPVAPDVELITYRGVDNKLLILFNQMIDQRAELPIHINESDAERFSQQYSAQNIPEGQPLMFESDDPAYFELFKTTKKPSNYSEFANEHYRLIGSTPAYSAAYVDNIVPNQTYYYMFRTHDRNQFVSNPSPIYEFTLVKEGETLYPRTRIVDLKSPDPPTQKTKSFKKYLKVGLAPTQYQISSDLVANINDGMANQDIQIGTAQDLLLGSNKTYKFRIKSKNTGKLIDINVTFKKNKVIKA